MTAPVSFPPPCIRLPWAAVTGTEFWNGLSAPNAPAITALGSSLPTVPATFDFAKPF
jgi:hypothetical protein